jgi:hypothetical protein
MNITSSVTLRRPPRKRVVGSAWLALLASIAVFSVGAQQNRQVRRFEGKTIPEAPGQHEAWTAPATKLPKFLVTATGLLFEQGVADPRGCEYREVEVGNEWMGKAHGFVLPERADASGRFVVCWDGLVYPALTVGAPANLDSDVNDLAAKLKQGRDAGEATRFNPGVCWSFSNERPSRFGFSGVDDRSPIKLCLLLRLGRADLAESLFAAGTSWTPAGRVRDLTDYHISYTTLAVDWASSAFGWLVTAHMSGEDVIALDTARKLAKFRDLTVARADAMGFPRPDRPVEGRPGSVSRFYFLTQLDELLRDHERRASVPARGPIPKRGTDASVRIAALIRDLDQIDEQQMMSPGGAYPGHSPLVHALIAEGDEAVPPLLTVVESDNRLTRSVSNGRGGSLQRFVHPVSEAAIAALIGILKTHEFDDRRFSGWTSHDPAARKALAASIRQYWEKTRSVPLVERWYRTLRDDSAGPARWLEAAVGIVEPQIAPGMPRPKRGTQPMPGEPLRGGRDPSVTALITRRVTDIERTANPQSPYDQAFASACRMGSILATWDKQASLQVLKQLMTQCRERSDHWLARNDSGSFDRGLASYLAEFTDVRLELGDLGVLDEYASWLRTTTPKMLEYATYDVWKPLLAHHDHPALAAAAKWLFNDPNSPWVGLVPEAHGLLSQPFDNLVASPLVVVPEFRSGVLARLADKAELGSVKRGKNGFIERKIKGLPTISSSATDRNFDGVAVDVEYPFRRCDFLASNLAELEGCPRFDLFWPEARRDEGVAACAAYLKRFGGLFTAEAPPGILYPPGEMAHLKFHALDRQATPEDVAAGRAIFSLSGQGESRRANMPGFPQKARWLTLKDKPVVRVYQPAGSAEQVTRHGYDTDGYIWQAEEVRNGDRWERFYGFVGHHVVARAPAAEIEFASSPGPSPWCWTLEGGLDARTALVEPGTIRYEPGRPILVVIYIRNRKGLAHASPTEFMRPGPDGKPALRQGVDLLLWRSTSPGPSVSNARPDEPVVPRQIAHFDAGGDSRSLAPLEPFEAMRFDLNDWFDVSQPGRYRFRLTFAADSGVGTGSATETHFQVGGDE